MPDIARIEVKRLAKPFKVQAAQDEKRTFAGHGSVFDDPHPTSSWALPPDFMDIVRPGAFKKALAEHKRIGTLPALLFDHDVGHLIGVYNAVAEDEDGLSVEGKIAQSARAETGEDIYELVSMGALTGLSIRFIPVRFKVDEKSKTRELIELTLPEISLTPFPGQAKARVEDVKSAQPAHLKRIVEEALRDAGHSREESKAIISAIASPALRDAAAAPEEQAFIRSIRNRFRA